MSTVRFTYNDLFKYAKKQDCKVDFIPPDTYKLEKNHSPTRWAVVASDDIENDEVSDDLVNGICKQLGIDPP